VLAPNILSCTNAGSYLSESQPGGSLRPAFGQNSSDAAQWRSLVFRWMGEHSLMEGLAMPLGLTVTGGEADDGRRRRIAVSLDQKAMSS
jgi:hypothetical protein